MRARIVVFASILAACGERQPPSPITVFAAASLARPLGALTDSFQRSSSVPARVELGGSLEHARKLTDLGRIPDVIMLVDDDVMASLFPAHLGWYVRFATNRIGVVFNERSPHADSISTENWWRLLARRDTRIGRADPNVAPVGRHALAIIRRIDGYYNRRGSSDTLLARADHRFMRPDATALAALLETGEVDFILDYESVARQYGFRFVALPDDLAPPILYGIGVPRLAANAADGVAFAAYVLADPGQRILRGADILVLSTPVAIGTVPPEIKPLVRTSAAPAVAPR